LKNSGQLAGPRDAFQPDSGQAHEREPQFRPTSFLDKLLGVSTEEERRRRGYLVYLLAVALLGWALASYDFNLLVLALPTISVSLHMSSTSTGALLFIVYAAMFVITLMVGYFMDARGRRVVWVFSLASAAVFTGLTYFAHSYWELAVVRALASGFANSELAISITLVNEELPAGNRGLLYAMVQGGWPVGVLIASAVWLGLHSALGWHLIFVIGVAPLLFIIVARIWVKESDRYLQMHEIREAKQKGDDERVSHLLEKYDVDVDEVQKVTVVQLFAEGGWVRRQLVRTTFTWLAYSAAFVATNSYIIYWMEDYRGISDDTATLMLLTAAGAGWFFYVIGGWLGEHFGRKRVLVASATVSVGLATLFYFVHGTVPLWIVYFVIYQVTNGTWSGVGYTYWAESFPTRVRGTAVGWLGAMFTGGLILGSGIWTLVIGENATIAWFVVAVGFAAIQLVLSFWLPRIPPGQELEEIAT